MTADEDSVRALHWLANQPERQGVLWDSHVMRAHDWSGPRPRSAASSGDGCILCREVPWGDRRVSVGFLHAT